MTIAPSDAARLLRAVAGISMDPRALRQHLRALGLVMRGGKFHRAEVERWARWQRRRHAALAGAPLRGGGDCCTFVWLSDIEARHG